MAEKPLRIDLRDKRLPGPKHRLDLSAGTTDPAVRDRRADALRKLLETERGLSILARLRAREITLEEVQRAVEGMDLASLEPQPDEAAGPGPHRIYLGATVDRFLADAVGNHLADNTIDSYRTMCASLEEKVGVQRDSAGRIVRDVEFRTITSQQGRAWLRDPKASNRGKVWSPNTQKRAHAVAAALWDLALLEDEEHAETHGTERTLVRNPWRKIGRRKGVQPAKVKKTRFEFLSRAEAARVLRENKGTERAAWIAVHVYAGLRVGETSYLRRGLDVDMEARQIRVQPREGRWSWRPKTENSVRDVPMHPRLARWIRQHEALGFAGDVFLFRAGRKERPLSESTTRKWTRAAFTAAGIQYGRKKDALTTHSLRHTFASWLTQADVHPQKIADLMGDTVETVMATYSHLVGKDLIAAILKL